MRKRAGGGKRRRRVSLPIVAKIEKSEALEVFDASLAATDAVIVASGELGVEIPPD